MRGTVWNSLEGFGTFLTFHLDLPGIPISKEEFCQGWSHQFSWPIGWPIGETAKRGDALGLSLSSSVGLGSPDLLGISWGSLGSHGANKKKMLWPPWKDAVIPTMWYPWLRHTHPCLVNLVNSPEIAERFERCMGYVRSETAEVGFELRQARPAFPAFPAFLWSPKLNHNFPLSKQSVVNQCSPWSNTENHICSVVLFIGKKHIYRIYMFHIDSTYLYIYMYVYMYTLYIYIWYVMIWKHGISYHSWHVASQGHHLRFQFVPPCRSRLQWHRQPWRRWHRWHRIPWCIRCHTWHHRCTICRMHYLHIRIRPGLNLIDFSAWRSKNPQKPLQILKSCVHMTGLHKQNHGFRKVV